MEYTNEKIRQLLKEREAVIEKYDREINKEIEKEKAKYKFDWKNFLILIAAIVLIILGFEGNKRLFPKTSIWSWEYYIK